MFAQLKLLGLDRTEIFELVTAETFVGRRPFLPFDHPMIASIPVDTITSVELNGALLIIISNYLVSHTHFVIRRSVENSKSHYRIENAKAGCGTYVEGKQIRGEVVLKYEDIIQAGPVCFQFLNETPQE